MEGYTTRSDEVNLSSDIPKLYEIPNPAVGKIFKDKIIHIVMRKKMSHKRDSLRRIITFPRMGIYTDILKEFFENLGLKVMLPPPITQETIKIGVRHSSDMMCFPFKVTFGSFIQSLEKAKKEKIKLTYAGIGTSSICLTSCRFQQYFEIQKKICEDLGYNFDTIFIERKLNSLVFGTIYAFKRMNPKNSYFKILKELLRILKKTRKEEKKYEYFDWNDKEKIRIGIVGEFYTMIEKEINYDIINKLRKMGVNVHTTAKYSSELLRGLNIQEVPRKFIKQAKKDYKGLFRSHGDISHWALYFYKHHNFDGVIHLMPLSCMPESTAEMIMDLTSKKLDLPIYRFPIDENKFEAGFQTRLETFVSILKRRKEINKKIINN